MHVNQEKKEDATLIYKTRITSNKQLTQGENVSLLFTSLLRLFQ